MQKMMSEEKMVENCGGRKRKCTILAVAIIAMVIVTFTIPIPAFADVSNASEMPESVKEYVVTFNANGGKKLKRGQRTLRVRADRVVGEMPVSQRSGYYFHGWYTQKKGGKRIYAISGVDKSRTLYAHWSRSRDTKLSKVWYAAKTGIYTGLSGKNKKIAMKMQSAMHKCLRPGMPRVFKAKAIHDWMVSNAEYDMKNYLNGTIPMRSYRPEGILLYGKGVCSGYAETYMLFMKSLGIPCKEAYGKNHAWNLVKLSGKYYHVDVTWDDPVNGVNIRYDYFLASDKQVTKGNKNHKAYGVKTSYVKDHPWFKKHVKSNSSYIDMTYLATYRVLPSSP